MLSLDCTVQDCAREAQASCEGRTPKHIVVVVSYPSWLKIAKRSNLSFVSANIAAQQCEFGVQLYNHESFEENQSQVCRICVLNTKREEFIRVIAIE